ncbi:MAG: hypothetical protein ABI670_11455 [Chloroflexota bacterium]
MEANPLQDSTLERTQVSRARAPVAVPALPGFTLQVSKIHLTRLLYVSRRSSPFAQSLSTYLPTDTASSYASHVLWYRLAPSYQVTYMVGVRIKASPIAASRYAHAQGTT